ncbi:MAG TPA: four-carbon acid sugar kinase family protein [Pseudomonadales bacterium]|nr:four-carbon acid sugar kinase family protein [Pseudomonadales bacterium]
MIGVIADDLTGAAEIGAVGLRHGLHAEIIRSGEPNGHTDIVCFDTDSRSCSPNDAAKRVATAAQILRAAGAQWIYKKVDSVLRGHVTIEIEAAMQQLKLDRSLLLPANPSLGRTIRDGHYFIHGKLIHKTEFGRDPEYPRRTSQVLRLLKVPEKFSICIGNGDRRLLDQTIVIGEAGTSKDVVEWAGTISGPETLPAGGSEFFSALLDREKPAASNGANQVPPSAPVRELFVCGTSTDSSRKFVTTARKRKQPVMTLPAELVWGAELSPTARASITRRAVEAFDTHSRVILAVGLPLVQDAGIARRLSQNIVQIAEGIINEVPLTHVFAEGGATASELVRRMRWPRLTVERELAPGVATLSVGSNQSTLFTIKPGTYTWPAQWT